MFTTRRKLLRLGYFFSIGTVIPPSFRRAHAKNSKPDVDIGISEFLLEWAELADWPTVSGANPAPAMHNSVMHGMSRKFVTDYFNKYGTVPTGEHRLRYHCGRDPSNDVTSNVCGPSRFYDKIFTYLGGNGISVIVLQK